MSKSRTLLIRLSWANYQQVGNAMKHNVDVPLATAGITSPMWLEPLNMWLGLVLVVLSIVLVCFRIWVLVKENK